RSFEPKQMLVVDPPSEIVFEGPFNRAVCKKVMVFNPCNYRVAFKLKTTTPRLFFVRPNVGLIKPNESFTIDIFMHPLVSNSSALRSNHKFLMQAVEANDFVPDLHSFWRSINPASIWDTKIKVKLIEGKTDVQQTGSDQEHGNGEHQDTDVNDPLGLLLKQVNTLEEEKQSLLKQVETL
ncbi:fan, partial [Drosophila busckii]